MSLRLVEIVLPQEHRNSIIELIKEQPVLGFWQEESSSTGLIMKVLLSTKKTEAFLDTVEKAFSGIEGFRLIMLPVETTLPRYDEKQEQAAEPTIRDPQKTLSRTPSRISREELYFKITGSVKSSRTFAALVVLSSIVAAVGLIRDQDAIIIGAMVIAPLLGPNVGLAFATTLGDAQLGRQALQTLLLGIVISLGFSMGVGNLVDVNSTIGAVASRTQVHLSDIALALAAGSAGVLSFTSGISTALIGVMVAVALLPPLVTLGLMIGSSQFTLALGSFLLLMTNLICVNLAGVCTFLVQGVRPRRWWEATKAKKAARLAIILWSGLLVILLFIIYFSQK